MAPRMTFYRDSDKNNSDDDDIDDQVDDVMTPDTDSSDKGFH